MLISAKKYVSGEKLFNRRLYSELFAESLSKLNYDQIELPTILPKEIFTDVGEFSEIVHKQMFVLENGMVLRPEGTMPTVHYVSCNKKNQKGLGLFYLHKMFRYEREQRMRRREFEQWGVELFGGSRLEALLSLQPLYELSMLCKGKIRLKLNCIGDENSLKEYSKAIVATVKQQNLPLSDYAQQRLENNAFKILDSKAPIDQETAKLLPKLETFLTEKQKTEYKDFINLLNALYPNFEIEQDQTMVRGLDYYRGVVFEVFSEEINLTICGGGDYYCQQFDVSGFGYAIGVERMESLLPEKAFCKIIVILVNVEAASYYLSIVRQAHNRVKFLLSNKGATKQRIISARKALDEKKADMFILVGSQEACESSVTYAIHQKEMSSISLDNFLKLVNDAVR